MTATKETASRADTHSHAGEARHPFRDARFAIPVVKANYRQRTDEAPTIIASY
ncbi:MAG: hypothetical protein ABI625_00760 [bacterium]